MKLCMVIITEEPVLLQCLSKMCEEGGNFYISWKKVEEIASKNPVNNKLGKRWRDSVRL